MTDPTLTHSIHDIISHAKSKYDLPKSVVREEFDLAAYHYQRNRDYAYEYDEGELADILMTPSMASNITLGLDLTYAGKREDSSDFLRAAESHSTED